MPGLGHSELVSHGGREPGLGVCPVRASCRGPAVAGAGRLERQKGCPGTVVRSSERSLSASWRHAGSARTCSAALNLSQDYKQRGYQAYVLRLLGEIDAHPKSSKVEQSEAHYLHALALADELGMRPLQAHCHRGLGTLYMKLEKVEQARTEFALAIELYRAMDMTFWLPKAALA